MSERTPRARLLIDSIGIFAVVVSLIFVGVEIRQNTAATQSATYQGIFEGAQQTLVNIIENERLREIMVVSEADPDWIAGHIGTADYLLLYAAYSSRFNAIENTLFHYLHGTYPQEAWQGTDGAVRVLASSSNMRYFWSGLRDGYMPEMQSYMDSVLALAH